MRHWCISTSAANWNVCAAHQLWGMDERYAVTLRRFVKEGDRAVAYAEGTFVAALQFVGDYFYDERDVGWIKAGKTFVFPYRIRFRLLAEPKVPPRIQYSTNSKGECFRSNLIDQITFIADKGKTWNQYFQVSIIRLAEEDFETIYQAILRS